MSISGIFYVAAKPSLSSFFDEVMSAQSQELTKMIDFFNLKEDIEAMKSESIDFIGNDKQIPVVSNNIMKLSLQRISLLSSEWVGFLNTMVVKSVKQQLYRLFNYKQYKQYK